MGEHGGTHIDSPYHFYKDGWTVDQIPPRNLIDVAGAVIDIEAQVESSNSSNYVLTVEDIIRHEMRGTYYT